MMSVCLGYFKDSWNILKLKILIIKKKTNYDFSFGYFKDNLNVLKL
jgi:hypothetical protein